MSLASTIASRIESLPVDTTFRYDALDINREQYATAAKVLQRLQAKGVIKKLSKGIFYKPRTTIFGELKPGAEEVLKDYLFENSKRVAYLTGTYLYNQLGLTTQLANVWRIATYNKRIFVQRGTIKALPIKSYAPITEENYKLLGYLDALKDWNTIPDLDAKQGIKRLQYLLQQFSSEKLIELIQYAVLYPPRVAAYLGALLSTTGLPIETEVLKKRLNSLTRYRLVRVTANLPAASNWQII